MTARHWIIFAFITMLLIVGAVLIASQQSVIIRLSEDDLSAQLNKQLPVKDTYLTIFDIEIDTPRVELNDGSDRIAGGADLNLTIRILGREVLFDGSADLTTAIEYRSETGEFFLIDPRVSNLKFSALPENFETRIRGAVEIALAAFYRDRPIYALDKTRAAQAAARLVLRDVVVRDGELVLTLSAQKGDSESSKE